MTPTKTIHKQGLEIVLNIIKTITPLNSDISRLIGIKSKNNDYSILTNLISVYIEKGMLAPLIIMLILVKRLIMLHVMQQSLFSTH